MSDLPPILFQDAALVAVDKPAGLLTVPDRWDPTKQHLLGIMQATFGSDCVNLHRLDRETSGVVLFALQPAVVPAVTEQFENQLVRKLYWALVSPPPRHAQGTINHALSQDSRRPGAMKIDPHGKPAQTDYEVLEQWRDTWAWLALRPRTGRTHQLRIHLHTIGSPIVGDTVYRGLPDLRLSQIKKKYRDGKHAERPLLERLVLHAAELTITHPLSNEPLTIQSPLPANMEYALQQMRRYV
jgi:23S rRNA pseudouridine1911/1915/1917 synthase